MHRYVLGGVDTHADLVAFDSQDGDLDAVSNQNRLPQPSASELTRAPLLPVKAHPMGTA